MSDNPPTLSYGSQNRPFFLRRKFILWAIGLFLLSIVTASLMPLVTPYVDQWKHLRKQDRMAKNVFPADTVVYTEDEGLIATLKDNPAHSDKLYRDTELGAPPDAVGSPPWLEAQFASLFPTRDGSVTLNGHYRGIRKLPSGEERLVSTGVSVFQRNERQRIISITYFAISLADNTPGSRGRADSLNAPSLILEKSDRLTMYVGRSEPTDPARWIVPYVLNGQPGELHLRLRNDAALLLTVASGPAKKAPRWWTYPDPIPPDNVDNPGGIWPPPTRPAGQPPAGP